MTRWITNWYSLSHEMTPDEVLEIEQRFGLDDQFGFNMPVGKRSFKWRFWVVRYFAAPVADVFLKLAATMELAAASVLWRSFLVYSQELCESEESTGGGHYKIVAWRC